MSEFYLCCRRQLGRGSGGGGGGGSSKGDVNSPGSSPGIGANDTVLPISHLDTDELKLKPDNSNADQIIAVPPKSAQLGDGKTMEMVGTLPNCIEVRAGTFGIQ